MLDINALIAKDNFGLRFVSDSADFGITLA
jgi:hypothetical protein